MNETQEMKITKATPLSIGLALAICVMVVGAALWMQRIADDVGDIKKNLAGMVADHEARIRVLEAAKKP